jgi:hypothetical protein
LSLFDLDFRNKYIAICANNNDRRIEIAPFLQKKVKVTIEITAILP